MKGLPAAGGRRTAWAAWVPGLLFVAACAAIGPAPAPRVRVPPPPAVEEAPPPADPFAGFPDVVRRRAGDAEARKELRKALFLWKVVLAFVPGDRESEARVRSLSDRVASEADAHFREGRRLQEAGDIVAARREYLLALANDPDHAGARDCLRNRLAGPDVVTYETREGDTLRKIAKERYDDFDKDALIAYFNDIDKGAALRPGTRLALPVLEPVPLVEAHEKAPKDILGYPGAADQDEADRLYRSGVRQFQAGEFEKAAQDWEKALRIDPGHAKARKDLDRVRRMLRNLK